jgi:hypothetical protein
MNALFHLYHQPVIRRSIIEFVKTFEQIIANTRSTADFYDAEMLTLFWETKPEIIAKLLPPPLKPAVHPIAMAFVAYYPSTNFDVTYRESALFVRGSQRRGRRIQPGYARHKRYRNGRRPGGIRFSDKDGRYSL